MTKINYYNWQLIPVTKRLSIQKVSEQCYRKLHLTFPISFIIVDRQIIRKLNNKYRFQDKVTDVLSFSYKGDQKNTEGEIYLCYQQIVKQAKEHKVTLQYEFSKMIIHGLLHLAGYDHEKEQDFQKMNKLEQQLLNIYYHESL